jgi:hypothetical protein
MFIEALIVSVIIGYILKGRLKNIDTNSIKVIYLVFTGFFIEAIMVMLIKNGLLVRGNTSYLLDAVMYLLLFIFIYLNRQNKWILLMGIGFFLNALPIFFNGGAMPVSTGAIDIVGITRNVTSEGLYVLINSSTKLSFLGDVIPIKYPRPFAASIGDIIAAIGLMLFIITGMKSKKKLKYLI